MFSAMVYIRPERCSERLSPPLSSDAMRFYDMKRATNVKDVACEPAVLLEALTAGRVGRGFFGGGTI